MTEFSSLLRPFSRNTNLHHSRPASVVSKSSVCGTSEGATKLLKKQRRTANDFPQLDLVNKDSRRTDLRLKRLSSTAFTCERTITASVGLPVRSKRPSHSLHQAVQRLLTDKPSSAQLSGKAIQSGNTKDLASPVNKPSTSRYHSDKSENITLASNKADRRNLLDRSPPLSRSPTPPRAQASGLQNKMHQTSSRLLRMTDEDRPFTRDFKDLFSTLIVSLPLGPHRVRFQKIEHTFTSEEAINNLGSLKFSQSNRMPDPKDPSRIVTTTTTTTFSMAREMARSVCQRFMDARFIESADGKLVQLFPIKGAVWQLTPKGMHVLTRFCQRNGINQRHVLDVMDSPRNTMQLVLLERDPTTDKFSHDRASIEVIFRRFAGQEGPNVKSSTSASDSDSLSDYHNGLVGVKMAKERKILGHVVQNTFTGKAAVDWLLDCCTTVDRRETYGIAELFVRYELIWAVVEDKVYVHHNARSTRFQPTKDAIYGLTDKGQRVAGWITREASSGSDKTRVGKSTRREGPRDSNNNRLTAIVNDAALRLLFREYLRDTHCEENLAFYLEVREFTKNYDSAEKAKAFTRLDTIRENLAAAYGVFLSSVCVVQH